ncbi:hypothetical protein EDD15DRAFT_2179597, partial [Pisolithus albus]
DFHVAILGANGAGDRYSSSSSHVPYDHEETVSNCTALRLAKRSQHSADQFLHDKSPTDLFQSIFHERWPVRSTMACRIGGREIWSIEINGIGRGLLCRSVVVTQLGKQHPHALFLDRPTSHDSHRHLALAIKAFEGGVVVVSHDSRAYLARSLWEKKDKKIKGLTRLGITVYYRVQDESYPEG